MINKEVNTVQFPGSTDVYEISDSKARESISNNSREIESLKANKQDLLKSEGLDQNIKTINNNSILGSGNIQIEGGGSSDYKFIFKDSTNVELENCKIVFIDTGISVDLDTISEDASIIFNSLIFIKRFISMDSYNNSEYMKAVSPQLNFEIYLDSKNKNMCGSLLPAYGDPYTMNESEFLYLLLDPKNHTINKRSGNIVLIGMANLYGALGEQENLSLFDVYTILNCNCIKNDSKGKSVDLKKIDITEEELANIINSRDVHSFIDWTRG